jgi:CDP-4-dehydro-6-deoxyglucose reductase, E3
VSKQHTVTLNGDKFPIRSGQVLLDAAMMAGVDIPHDCRAGRCGTCLTRVQRGITLGGDAGQPGVIHACQARVFSDLTLEIEALPAVQRVSARVTKLVDVTHDVVEVTMEPSKSVDIWPGQYCRFTFQGFPARAFSPTPPLNGSLQDGFIHLNIKRVRNGCVSTNLGGKIKPGHRVTIDGPFGHAFLRPSKDKRLVLVGSGTGFAPVWAIAHAALCENSARHIVIATGVRELSSFYMGAALEFMRAFPNVVIVATVEEEQSQYPIVRVGRPTDHLPPLSAGDIVYAAGAPKLVATVGDLSREAHSTFYSDPFEPAESEPQDWLTRAAAWLGTG